MWSILENVPFTLEKVYSSAFGWNVLKISMRSILSNVSFKTCVSLLIFCFDDLSIGVSGVFKKVKVKSLSHVRLFATPWTVAYQAPLSMGFSRQECWEWVAISFSRGSSQPRDRTRVSCIVGRRFYHLSHQGSLLSGREMQSKR